MPQGNDTSAIDTAGVQQHKGPEPRGDDISAVLRVVGVKYAVRLASRRNRVFRALMQDGSQCIVKVYSPDLRERLPRERSVLRKASELSSRKPEVRIPKLLGQYIEENGAALIIEYIPGENLCDVLNCEVSPAKQAPRIYVESLAQWYAGFHEQFCTSAGNTLLRGDSILRNFIVVRSESGACSIAGVDFEQATEGDPAVDIGETCCSILDTNPMFTRGKVALCREFIQIYGQLSGYTDIPRIKNEISVSMRVVASRRPQQKHIIEEKLAIFEKEGFLGLEKTAGDG